MRHTFPSLILSALLAGSAIGQCNSLPTTGALTGFAKGTMFDVVPPLIAQTIGSFDQVFASNGVSDVEIYTKTGTWQGFETNPGAWSLLGGTTVAHSYGQLVPIPIPVNVTVPTGATQAFYITVTDSTPGVVGTTQCINQLGNLVISSLAVGVTVGVAKDYPFAATVGLPVNGEAWCGHINICTSFSSTIASATTLGNGCGGLPASFYEAFASPSAFDLNGTSMRLSPANGGYHVTNGGAFLPVGTVGPPSALLLGDDATTTVNLTVMGSFPTPSGPLTSLVVCSNGHVSTAPGNGAFFLPNRDLLLYAPRTIFGCVHDFNPTAGGAVRFEQSPAVAVLTWDNVRNYNGTGPAADSTWQIQFHANGEVVFSWLTMSALGNGYLVGYSAGGGDVDPGSSDLSALGTNPISVGWSDRPLMLSARNRPRLNTTWFLTTSEIPPTGALGVDVLGLADPGVLDLGFLGMPGCQLRSSLDVLNAWVVAGSNHYHSFFVPNNPAIVGVHVFTAGAVFMPGINPFGAITSNGLDGLVGTL
jgi:hypothetical protein